LVFEELQLPGTEGPTRRAICSFGLEGVAVDCIQTRLEAARLLVVRNIGSSAVRQGGLLRRTFGFMGSELESHSPGIGMKTASAGVLQHMLARKVLVGALSERCLHLKSPVSLFSSALALCLLYATCGRYIVEEELGCVGRRVFESAGCLETAVG